MTTYVTISSEPQSHWAVDIVRVDGASETKLATLNPGESHSNHVWAGAKIEIREADIVQQGATP